MTITRHPTLWCDWPDGCGKWADVGGGVSNSDVRLMRRNAVRAGWTRRDGLDYCPEHSASAPDGEVAA